MRMVTPQGIVWLGYKAIRTADLNQVSRVINTDRFRSKIKVLFDLPPFNVNSMTLYNWGQLGLVVMPRPLSSKN